MKIKNVMMLVSGKRVDSGRSVILPVPIVLTADEYKQGLYMDMADAWASENGLTCITVAKCPKDLMITNREKLHITISEAAYQLDNQSV